MAKPETRATDEERRELHEAYRDYTAAMPWRYMPQDAPLIIHDEIRRETGCLVSGDAGGVPDGVVYYPGRRGLAAYLRAGHGMPDSEHCLTAMTAPKTHLGGPEIREIAVLRMRYRKDGRWPMFRSHLPGHPPWKMNGEETTRMSRTLRLATRFAEHIQANGGGTRPHEDPERYPSAPIWWSGERGERLEWHELPEPSECEPAGKVAKMDRLEKLTGRREPDETWMIAELYYPHSLYDHAGQEWRPHYPTITMAASEKGSPNQQIVLCINRPSTETRQDGFYAIVNAMGRLPGAVLVNSPIMLDSLRPVGQAISVSTKMDREMSLPQELVTTALSSVAEAMEAS